MIFSNINIDPINILQLAETESRVWLEVQATIPHRASTEGEGPLDTLPDISGRWCFTDGSWKERDLFLGQGCYSTLEGFDGLMGARNTRASISSLHSEVDAFIWAMESMKNLRQF